jgi:hypothetical protein
MLLLRKLPSFLTASARIRSFYTTKRYWAGGDQLWADLSRFFVRQGLAASLCKEGVFVALTYRREVLRGLAASGIVLSSVGRNVAALECNKPDAKHVVIGKQTSDVSGFDPHLNSSASAAEIIGNLYETLITLKDGKAVPGLATWKSEGALWTFAIKPDQRFASGNRITAADAAFSFKRALKINNSPALPLAHLGLTFGNAEQCINIGKSGELPSERDTLIIALPTYVEESIVLHCLTSVGCSILDSDLIKSRWSPNPRVLDTHGCATFGNSFYPPDVFVPYLCRFSARDDGEAWLRFNSAGSGPFQIRNAERTDEIAAKEPLPSRLRQIVKLPAADCARRRRPAGAAASSAVP